MKYHVRVPVTSVYGYQVWSVEADSERGAIQSVKSGGGEFVEEEVEVMSLDFDGAFAEMEDAE